MHDGLGPVERRREILREIGPEAAFGGDPARGGLLDRAHEGTIGKAGSLEALAEIAPDEPGGSAHDDHRGIMFWRKPNCCHGLALGIFLVDPSKRIFVPLAAFRTRQGL
jgi:hypothetical protein